MNPELYAAMLQRMSLQLVTHLNSTGFVASPESIVAHIDKMRDLAVALCGELRPATAAQEAEKVN